MPPCWAWSSSLPTCSCSDGSCGCPGGSPKSEGLRARSASGSLALFGLAFVLIDLFDYGFHRLLHRWRWLWLIHSVHHSDPQLDASRNGIALPSRRSRDRGRAEDVPSRRAGDPPVGRRCPRGRVQSHQPAPARQCRVSALDRAAPRLAGRDGGHASYRSLAGCAKTNSNYGAVFSFWDRWFGTYVAPDPARVPSYGLRKLAADSWQTVAGMMLTPIRARRLGAL